MSGPYPDRRELLAASAAALAGGLATSATPQAANPVRKKYPFKKSINLWAFPYPERMTLEQCLRLAKDAGFDGIELNYDLDNDLSPKAGTKDFQAIRKTAADIGIAISGVCSFLYWPYSLTSNDPAQRSRVLLMPQGTTSEAVRQRGLWLVEQCKEHGFRYCPRLHLDLFGNRRGT